MVLNLDVGIVWNTYQSYWEVILERPLLLRVPFVVESTLLEVSRDSHFVYVILQCLEARPF